MNLRDKILNGVKNAGDRTAFVTEHESVSYKELLLMAESLVQFIKSKNIKPASYLCIEVSRNKDFLVGLLASIILQLVLVPLKYGLNKGEKVGLINTSTPEHILTKEEDQWVLSKTTHNVANDVRNITPEGGFVRPTSGTTNTSKGVLISIASALERVNASIESLQLNSSDTVLCLMAYPYHFIASLLSFISTGTTILTPNVFSEEGLKDSCKQNSPTIIYASPYHFALLSEMNLKLELRDIRLAISTGTKLPSSTKAKFAEHYEKPITEIFGIIEVGLALQNSGSEVDLLAISPIENKINEQGELLLKGPGLFDAYLSPFKLSSEVLENSWFNTGDLAARTESGGIMILGRSNSVIHIGAHKVFPEEIEENLLEINGISQARVFAIKHDLFGSEIHADIITTHDLEEKEILTYIRKNLGSLKTPKKINFIDTIELTQTGKTKRVSK